MTSRPQTSSRPGLLNQSSSWNQIPQSSCEKGLGCRGTAGNQEQEQSSIISTCRCQRTQFPPCRSRSALRDKRRPINVSSGSEWKPWRKSNSLTIMGRNLQQGSNKQTKSSFSNIDIFDWASSPCHSVWWMLVLFAPGFTCSEPSGWLISQTAAFFPYKHFLLQSNTYWSYQARGGFPLNAWWEWRGWIMQRELIDRSNLNAAGRDWLERSRGGDGRLSGNLNRPCGLVFR